MTVFGNVEPQAVHCSFNAFAALGCLEGIKLPMYFRDRRRPRWRNDVTWERCQAQ
jgi:hypothetical protein